MKNKTPITLLSIALIGMFSLTGCSTAQRALRVTQSIGGTGSVTLGTVSVMVENARQEDGEYKADKLDLIGPRVKIHMTDYSRPLIPAKGEAK